MLRRSLLLMAVASMGGCGPSWPSGAGEPTPRLRVDKTIHDFGAVAPGSILQTRFLLGNEGAARVVVNPADARCNCGEPPAPTLVISPGETATLLVPFHMPDQPGLAEKCIVCTTSDPKTPRLTLTIRAQVRRGAAGNGE